MATEKKFDRESSIVSPHRKWLAAAVMAFWFTSVPAAGGEGGLAADRAETPPPATAHAANPPPQIGSWGFDLSGMDRNIGPGDDFYLHANGTWVRTFSIRDDQSHQDVFVRLEELSASRTHEILAEAARTPGSKIGDFYASFMNRDVVNARGLDPLAPVFARIDAIGTPGQLAAEIGGLIRMGVYAPWDVGVDSDDKNPDQALPILFQSGLGLYGRDYYLGESAELEEKRQAYRGYLVRLLELTGAENAEARADAVFDLEREIARVHWSQIDSRDPEKSYNRLSPEYMEQSAPEFAWASFFEAAGIGNSPILLVRQPSAILESARIISAASLPVLKDYLKLHTINIYAPYLSQAYVDVHFDFHGKTMGGLQVNQEEWRRASNLVSFALGEEIGKIYVERYFPPEAKAEADRLTRNILAAWDRRIQNLEWMSDEAKARARAKLAALVVEIGYPVRWRDYSTLEVRRDDLAGNVIRANQFEHQRLLNRLGRPIDKREWYTQLPPMGVNGYANHKWNQVVFSAGIMQPPFFDFAADPAVNYGGIGTVIAHEIAHHFDDQGSRYDENGVLREWWTAGDRESFDALGRRLIEQYDRYEPLPGRHVNGAQTLGENIADLAGVVVAFDAYRASLDGREPPALDGLNGDQRFFLGWAQVWRGKYREQELMGRLMTDTHAPTQQRVWTVRNIDSWYDAFGVRPGDTLYLPPEHRVRIW